MIVLLILFLIVSIIVLTIKYILIHAKELSHKEFRSAASQRAADLKYEDPVLNCDYCGAAIDTSKHSVCPNCGGVFDKDSEWKKRHTLDPELVSTHAEELSEEKIEQTGLKAAKTAKKLKTAIIVLCVIFGLLIAVAIIGNILSKEQRFQKNETVNSSAYEHYEKQAYQIEGDDLLLDQNGLTVRLTGFYAEEDAYKTTYHGEEYSRVKLEYQVQNNSDKNILLRFTYDGINGIASEDDFGFFYALFKKGTSVTVYDNVGRVRNGVIKEILLSEIKISDEEYTIEENIDDKRFLTDADYDYTTPSITGNLQYEDHGIQILVTKAEESIGRYLINIINTTDTDYEISSSNIKVNGREEDRKIYKSALPAHYTFISYPIYSRTKENEDPDSFTYECSLSFSCADDPSKDFSTGYFVLQE